MLCGLLLTSCDSGGGGGEAIEDVQYVHPITGIGSGSTSSSGYAPASLKRGDTFTFFNRSTKAPSITYTYGAVSGMSESYSATSAKSATLYYSGNDADVTVGSKPGSVGYTPPTKRSTVKYYFTFTSATGGTYTCTSQTTYVSTGNTATSSESGSFSLKRS